ncbi:MAG: amidohydrolase family protein [Candidatus Bathyarchaeota archaeon]|nr:amidohydrolase family protein [Candidatus Bathyarchaeota archaeon]
MALDFSKFKKQDVTDCHVHLWMLRNEISETLIKQQETALNETIKESGIQAMYTFSRGDDSPLTLKQHNPDKFYAGAYAPWSGDTDNFKVKDWNKYITDLKQQGYDGIGEMGSKTTERNRHTPLDSQYYAGFWDACETHDFPVLCHIGDVEDFWYEETTPQWAKDRNWGYYNGDYPTLTELYTEIENVLTSHPDLKITLCHFLFMSPDIEQAEQFLQTYPNANLDLSLGVELMYNISRNHNAYRDFFRRYDDRILFGTDIGMSKTLPEHLARIWLIRNFLETDEEFYTVPEADELLTRYEQPYIGLNLPRSSLEKIYAANFRRLWG